MAGTRTTSTKLTTRDRALLTLLADEEGVTVCEWLRRVLVPLIRERAAAIVRAGE